MEEFEDLYGVWDIENECFITEDDIGHDQTGTPWVKNEDHKFELEAFCEEVSGHEIRKVKVTIQSV